MSCDLCKKNVDDSINFGAIMKKFSITVHYFCVLLSTNLAQLGSDNAGFLGFQKKEVAREIKKAAKRKCIYCNDFHASISCGNCGDYFHLKCGLENDCNFQFIGEFKSYCNKHNDYKNESPYSKNSICGICYSPMGKFDAYNSIVPNCCKLIAIHKRCLQKYALSAGYYLRCIGCSFLGFRENVKYYGIFVPDCDASWELDPDFFKLLYETYSKCDAKICYSSMGREYSNKNIKKWQIITCNICAKSGIHDQCLTKIKKTNDKVYTCEDCVTVFNDTICARNVETLRTLTNGTLQLQIDEASHRTDQNNINNNFYLKKVTSKEVFAQPVYDKVVPRVENAANFSTYPPPVKLDDLASDILEFYERDFRTNKIVKIIKAKLKNGVQLSDNTSHEDLEIIQEISAEPDGSFKVGEYLCYEKCLLEKAREMEKGMSSLNVNSNEKIDLCESSAEENVEELFEKIKNKKYLNVPKPFKK